MRGCWLILEVRSQIVYFWSIFLSSRVPICTLAQGSRLLLCWSRILLQNRRRYVGKLLATAIFISLPSEGIECRSTSELWNCFCRQIRHPAQENPGSKDCPERSCCATSKGWAATSSNAICSCVAEYGKSEAQEPIDAANSRDWPKTSARSGPVSGSTRAGVAPGTWIPCWTSAQNPCSGAGSRGRG